jgi:hypothetical protein
METQVDGELPCLMAFPRGRGTCRSERGTRKPPIKTPNFGFYKRIEYTTRQQAISVDIKGMGERYLSKVGSFTSFTVPAPAKISMSSPMLLCFALVNAQLHPHCPRKLLPLIHGIISGLFLFYGLSYHILVPLQSFYLLSTSRQTLRSDVPYAYLLVTTSLSEGFEFNA